MNALRLRPVVLQVVRQQRLKTTMASKAFPPLKKYNFKQSWLSDPSTYPIMVIMASGLTFMVGMGFNALFTYKQVDISPNQRGRTMKQYSPEHRTGVVERYTTFKGGVNPEGLGIDHQEWQKKREEYLKEWKARIRVLLSIHLYQTMTILYKKEKQVTNNSTTNANIINNFFLALGLVRCAAL